MTGKDVMVEMKITLRRDGVLILETSYPSGTVEANKVIKLGMLSTVTSAVAQEFTHGKGEPE